MVIEKFPKSGFSIRRSVELLSVIFHPVQKSLDRMIQIDYTVRVQSLSTGM